MMIILVQMLLLIKTVEYHHNYCTQNDLSVHQETKLQQQPAIEKLSFRAPV
jgi:hypothetical protein